MSRPASPETVSCSFCGKSQHDVAQVVAGPGVYICNECVALCHQIIDEELDLNNGREAIGKRTATSGAPPALKAGDELSDEELLAEMVRVHASHQNVDRAVAEHVAALRSRGISWARIGEALGMTRQSAWERFSGEE